MEGFAVSVVKDLYMKGEFWGLHVDPTYKQESASAFLGCSVVPGKGKQHCDAVRHRTQVRGTGTWRIAQGQPKDRPL